MKRWKKYTNICVCVVACAYIGISLITGLLPARESPTALKQLQRRTRQNERSTERHGTAENSDVSYRERSTERHDAAENSDVSYPSVKMPASIVGLDYASRPLDYNLIVILIHSEAKNIRLRNAIRCSWGQPNELRKHNASLRFVMGNVRRKYARLVKNEELIFRDIMRLNIADTYKNLSLKSVESLRWISRNRIKTKYILKQDDDAFVRLDRLTAWLAQMELSGKHEFIAGKTSTTRKPDRSPKSRYYTPFSTWKFNTWPSIAFGPAYVITAKVIERLLPPADTSLPYLVPWEDVYVTGILREMQDIPLLSVPLMKHSRCGATSYTVSYHRVTVSQHMELHQTSQCSMDEVRWIIHQDVIPNKPDSSMTKSSGQLSTRFRDYT